MFTFKQFTVHDSRSAMKVGTDGVILGAIANAGDNVATVIDVGCGSGLIALMMAQRYPGVRIYAVEIEEGAVADASGNVHESPWSDRITVMQGDILSEIHELDNLSHPICIVSNPPFYTETLRSPSESRALARHGEGLNPLTLIARAATIMKEGQGDSLCFIAPAESDGDIRFALSLHRLAPERVTEIIPRQGRGAIRRIYTVKPERDVTQPCVDDTLIIRNADGSLTDEYKLLTHEFYLDR